MGTAEEMVDDGKTRGKTITRTQGLATWKESWNGVVEWRLAGSEYIGGLPQGGGKSCGKEEASAGWTLL
jgi:hypothetical protein